ncbi:glycerate kinase [Mobiluncus mulieris]|uniref:Glycerate kinase n=1 Tax=Mobiluncus mulieris TaxID=2052 RepID=A0ABD4TUP2_9ACTO|nr:glycerate kinase [Mobiluncus mulieris]MCU9968110.1 glycerate kinase [Mobiluncus mulieris]MCU9972289.1 glycerate kinase [Mobiluncus mulieris]MCV0008379.1 glycerate kinase [Mobiluncus mulieris]NMX00266.1 glycerate kinase [Mobiluncus mulieris]NMX19080.1 glycerate kinase [Mobiluncus mulieris]
MKIVIAPDSFKGALSAQDAAAAMHRGVETIFPDAECVTVPVSDGGEGTAEVMLAAYGGEVKTCKTIDALGREREAEFTWIPSQKMVVMDTAEAAGIMYIGMLERNIMESNTEGVGMILKAALDLQPETIIVGLGGSATNDGGWGMMYNLGARLYNESGESLDPKVSALPNAAKLDLSGLDSRLQSVKLIAANDVRNPLTGPTGASAAFGPQKGAKPLQLGKLDRCLKNWGRLLEETTGRQIVDQEGAGAAGGMAAAFFALGAENRKGFDVVAEATHLNEALDGADLVLTGEGQLDRQTQRGKTPWSVAQLGRSRNIPVIAFAAKLGIGHEILLQDGFTAIVPIMHQTMTSDKSAMEKVPMLLEDSVTLALQLMTVGANPAISDILLKAFDD